MFMFKLALQLFAPYVQLSKNIVYASHAITFESEDLAKLSHTLTASEHILFYIIRGLNSCVCGLREKKSSFAKINYKHFRLFFFALLSALLRR